MGETITLEIYLRECKKRLLACKADKSKRVVAVLGNESCDLDSAVSAIIYGYYLQEILCNRRSGGVDSAISNEAKLADCVVPVLNVKREDLRLRTEVAIFLEETSINLEDLICKDEIVFKDFRKNLYLAIVDHNVLSDEYAFLRHRVVHIVDHHVEDKNAQPFSSLLEKTIRPVGSCSTLVAQKVFSANPPILDPQVAMLLYGTILLDTVNLSENAQRATPTDHEMVEKLEVMLEGISRDEVYQTLVKAKSDISGFTPRQLLQKDCKIVRTDSLNVSISSIPLLLEVFLNNSEPMEPVLTQFCTDNHFDAIILMGSKQTPPSTEIRKQIAIFTLDSSLRNNLCKYLESIDNSALGLTTIENKMPSLVLYEQKNTVLTRKFILPNVQNFTNETSLSDPLSSLKLADKKESSKADCHIDAIQDPLSSEDIIDDYQVETLDVPDSPKHNSLLDVSKDFGASCTANTSSPDNPEAEGKETTCTRRKIIAVHPHDLHDSGNDDQKSLSSLSNKSDNDVFSPADKLEGDDVDTPEDLENSDISGGLESTWSEPIPEMSAAEEYEEERSWKTCFVSGEEKRIDMKVIDPYKKVLSHGGYHRETKNAIIIFSACYLPDRSRKDYDYVMDNLFLYVLTTLDQLVAEDYVLVYLHGATQRSNMPSFGWLKRCYQMIDRRLRKNLKGLYLVHPTFWLKTIVIMTKPFISSKFSRKLKFVSSLNELADLIPMDQVCIPDKVKILEFERMIKEKKKLMKKKKTNHVFITYFKERY